MCEGVDMNDTLHVQEVVRIDKQQGLIALGRFKSCVRTSLLLCGGYECQEKEGTFMIAFPQPRAAVEWALTLQLALLRYTCFTVHTKCEGVSGQIRKASTVCETMLRWI